MKDSQVFKVILLLTGLPLTVLGSWRVFGPVSFYANSGMTLEPSINLLSEARGAGGVVVGFGLLILLGIFVKQLRFTSSIASFMVFYSYLVARLISIGIDGIPGDVLIQGITGEFVLGTIGLIGFIKYRDKNS